MRWKIRGTSTWHALAGVRANSSGTYTYSRYWGAALEYRVYFPATAYIWNVATPTASTDRTTLRTGLIVVRRQAGAEAGPG